MSGDADLPGSPSNEAAAQLGRLQAQVAAMRAVLVQLLQDVVAAEAQLDHGEASLLLKANEQLIVSALEAQRDADTAHGALDEVARLANMDALTGLPNRTVLLDRFEAAIAHAKRHGHRVALLFLDLDAFKQINDTFGHAAGDRALRCVADCLTSLVRETDTVSRHGGDEFLVLLAEVANAADARTVAEKVNLALAAHGQSDSPRLRLQLRASIGIGLYPEDGADARTLIAFADAAMYRAKKRYLREAAPGRNTAPGPAGTSETPHGSPRRSGPSIDAAPSQAKNAQADLREANERLVLAALGAQELLAAAQDTRRRQAELLAMVAHELSDPYAPIRLAASTLGFPGAQAMLLPRVQSVIETQAERLAGMVREVIGPPDPDLDEPPASGTPAPMR